MVLNMCLICYHNDSKYIQIVIMVQNMSSVHHDNTTNFTFTCYTCDRFGKAANHY